MKDSGTNPPAAARRGGAWIVLGCLALAAVAAAIWWPKAGQRDAGDATASARVEAVDDDAAPSAPEPVDAPDAKDAARADAELSPDARLRHALLSGDSFLAVYQSLMALDPDQLKPYQQYYLAMILDVCHSDDMRVDVPADLLEPSASDSPQVAAAKRRARERGIAALCAGIPRSADTSELIASLYEAAAARGDARASAWLIERALLDTVDHAGPGTPMRMPSTPDETQRQQLLAALASGDPLAIPMAGRLLTRGYTDFGVAFGDAGVTPSTALEAVMWDLIACEYGAGCGSEGRRLTLVCATEGVCNHAHWADYVRQHRLTPQDLQDFARIYPAIRAGIDRGDWSGVRFLPNNPRRYMSVSRLRFRLGG